MICLEFYVVHVQIQRGDIMANGENIKGRKNQLSPLSTEKPKNKQFLRKLEPTVCSHKFWISSFCQGVWVVDLTQSTLLDLRLTDLHID